jgi:catechol 2,3-dioxygenase-like lactoylglutathione lyase family enzyme
MAAMEINGVAHTFITAGDFEKSVGFYRQLLPFLGLREVADSADTYYCVGGRTGFGIRRPAPEHAGVKYEQFRPGSLHHQCWRVRDRAEVEAVYGFLVSIGATIVHGPQEDRFAPGYYSVLFEDPDGVRLEVNHVPGRGLFDTATGRVGASLDDR